VTSDAFRRTLTETGFFLPDGEPAPGMTLQGDPDRSRLRPILLDKGVGLNAEAVFSSHATPVIIFKDAGDREPTTQDLDSWHEAAWNFGLAPLLWVVTPSDVRLYNCYAAPEKSAPRGRLTSLERYPHDLPEALQELNATCGRFATETGAFWSSAIGSKIDRNTRVDRQLLEEIRALENKLSVLPPHATVQQNILADESVVARDFAQRLIGRCIFAWYLIDRNIARKIFPKHLPLDPAEIFSDKRSVLSLFRWLRLTFNGDLFPIDDIDMENARLSDAHLALIRQFIEGQSLVEGMSGQGRLFRFRFNAIPVELISSVYEQFARTGTAEEADRQSLHYTPVELVNFILDPVFDGLPASARVIDPSCGSGVFLVEAFRRLVWKKTLGRSASRRVVRDVLYNQLFGVDINRVALGIAAFSLYLAALELDDEPIEQGAKLKFERLIGKTLFELDATIDKFPSAIEQAYFDAVIGNPPWKFVTTPTDVKGRRSDVDVRPRRSPDWDFVFLADRLTGGKGRIGMVVKASPFFSRDKFALQARNKVFSQCVPLALINLSQLRKEGLFSDVMGPAALFFSRCTLMAGDSVLVGSIPWTASFRRNGVFNVGLGDMRTISLDRVISTPAVLKAAAVGMDRDTWLIERLESENSFMTIGDWLEEVGIHEHDSRGQGFKVHGDVYWESPREYFKLRVIDSNSYTPFRIKKTALERFDHKRLHRPRKLGIFRGPLLICPKGQALKSVERGRYSAAFCEGDCLYTESFYGISFSESDLIWCRLLCGILNSSIAAFQLAFGGGGWGFERATVSPNDLLAIRIPDLRTITEPIKAAIVEAVDAVAAKPLPNTLCALDDAVFDLYDLDSQERTVVADSVMRARPLIFGNRPDFRRAAEVPKTEFLVEYAVEFASAVNAFLRTRGVRHLEGRVYPSRPTIPATLRATNLTAVRFSMVSGAPNGQDVKVGRIHEIEGITDILQRNMRTDLPSYLGERRQLRIYEPDTVLIVKPAEQRYWSRTAALDDADAILADHWVSSRNVERP
jgi:N-6 DNA methylase